jgi:Mg-chelatase subunit ChlI
MCILFKPWRRQMTKRYQTIWRRAEQARNNPKAFEQAYVELQHELEREARETLRVHTGRPAVELTDKEWEEWA